MPRDTPVHQLITRMLDESYAAEYDRNNGYLAVILLPSSRINLIPQTLQALSTFLNAMDASKEAVQVLSLEYTASYTYGLLALRKGAMCWAFSAQATQALCAFLEEELNSQGAALAAATATFAALSGWVHCASCSIWTGKAICPHCGEKSGA